MWWFEGKRGAKCALPLHIWFNNMIWTYVAINRYQISLWYSGDDGIKFKPVFERFWQAYSMRFLWYIAMGLLPDT